jgi:hypothetical protein
MSRRTSSEGLFEQAIARCGFPQQPGHPLALPEKERRFS